LLIFSLAVTLCACNREPMQKKPDLTASDSNEVLIKFKPGVPEDSVQAVAAKLGLEQIRELPEIGVRVFRTTSRVSAQEVLKSCQRNPHIEYAEPNTKVKIPEKND
jgi:hypothetical protein